MFSLRRTISEQFASINVDLDSACPGLRRKVTNHNLQISITHLWFSPRQELSSYLRYPRVWYHSTFTH